MTRARVSPIAFVVLAAVVSGLLFAPVFGLPPLLLAVLVPALAMAVVAVVASRRESLVPWRGVLVSAAGLLGIVETSLLPTTVGGVPTGDTVRVLVQGATESWRLTLQSTWPARPEPELLLFVPLLVILAAVLGVELLERAGALPALVPSFAVLLLSQLYSSQNGAGAAAAALAYAAAAGGLLAVTRADRTADDRRPAALVVLVAPAVTLSVVGAIVAGAAVPVGQPTYTLKDEQYAPLAQRSVTGPLDKIADRLAHPGTAVFKVDGAKAVDRWPVVVLTEFDGVNWKPGGQYRRMGASLRPSRAVAADVERRSARIGSADLGGPWVPTQTWPADVTGLAPLVEEEQGTLLVPDKRGSVDYRLSWWEPQVGKDALGGAEVDPDAPGGLAGVGAVPPRVAELAEQAVGGTRPTFRTAVALERYLRQNYEVATGADLPTGHAWPQLTRFLLDTQRGTSEQFAAAYVAMARILGIPARLVVGFRAPPERGEDGSYTVRNGDALAWPEVAVEGIGWVPLDPSGAAATTGAAGRGLAEATAGVRERLPPAGRLGDPPVAPSPVASTSDSGGGWALPLGLLLAVPLALVAVWVLGVPLVKAWRARRRRRRSGAGSVVGAWEEARDRLRSYGVPVSAGMTVRDLTAMVADTDRAAADGLRSLGMTVDAALWSAAGPGEGSSRDAWVAVRAVRRGLAGRGLRAFLVAAVDPRPLRRLR